jgi:hypothetical protein
MNHPFTRQLRVLCFLGLLLQVGLLQAESAPPISGRALEVNTVLPADVLARTKLLFDELLLIRFEMGLPEKGYQPLEVVNASPREVYFEALALFTKANRLAYEQTGFLEQEPKLVNVASIRPYHAWHMVDRALQRVAAVKKALQIPELSHEIARPVDTRPDHVYSAVVDANRLINSLLTKRFSPSYVYQQITVASYTVAQILATFPGVERIPEEQRFERRKKPGDVYKRLLDCHQLLRNIAQFCGNRVLEFKKLDVALVNKAPSDVYDMAALLVADISHLHALRKTAKRPAKSYYPGIKVPSHVYQRAGILKQQLETLMTVVEKEPDWLSH